MEFTRLWRRLGRLDTVFTRPAHAVPVGDALPAYVALGHWSPARAPLEPRLELLVGQLAAELSACQWCIDRGRHRWLRAWLPRELLAQLRSFDQSSAFTEREQAALALVEAVARHSRLAPGAAEQALDRARRYFPEPEVARIAAVAAEEHFFDPATGAIGLDAAGGGDNGGMPWRAIDAGIAVRGLT